MKSKIRKKIKRTIRIKRRMDPGGNNDPIPTPNLALNPLPNPTPTLNPALLL